MTNWRRNPGANQRPPSMLVIHILVQWIPLLNIWDTLFSILRTFHCIFKKYISSSIIIHCLEVSCKEDQITNAQCE